MHSQLGCDSFMHTGSLGPAEAAARADRGMGVRPCTAPSETARPQPRAPPDSAATRREAHALQQEESEKPLGAGQCLVKVEQEIRRR